MIDCLVAPDSGLSLAGDALTGNTTTTQHWTRSLINIPGQAIATGFFDALAPDGQKTADGSPESGHTLFAAAARFNSFRPVAVGARGNDFFINSVIARPTPSLALFTHGNVGVAGFGHDNIQIPQWERLKGNVTTIYLLGCQVA